MDLTMGAAAITSIRPVEIITTAAVGAVDLLASTREVVAPSEAFTLVGAARAKRMTKTTPTSVSIQVEAILDSTAHLEVCTSQTARFSLTC